jgi:predicted ArsR family transcriptional regulator
MLTKYNQRVLDYLKDNKFTDLQTIANALNLSAKSNALYHLRILVKNGYLTTSYEPIDRDQRDIDDLHKENVQLSIENKELKTKLQTILNLIQ